MTRAERRALSAASLSELRARSAAAEALPPLAIGTAVRVNADTGFETRGVVASVAIAPSGRYAYTVTLTEGPYTGCAYRHAAGSLKPVNATTHPTETNA